MNNPQHSLFVLDDSAAETFFSSAVEEGRPQEMEIWKRTGTTTVTKLLKTSAFEAPIETS